MLQLGCSQSLVVATKRNAKTGSSYSYFTLASLVWEMCITGAYLTACMPSAFMHDASSRKPLTNAIVLVQFSFARKHFYVGIMPACKSPKT